MSEVQAGAILAILPLLMLFVVVDARWTGDIESGISLREILALLTVVLSPAAMLLIIIGWMEPKAAETLDSVASLFALVAIFTTGWIAFRMTLIRLGWIKDPYATTASYESGDTQTQGVRNGFSYDAKTGKVIAKRRRRLQP